MNDQIALIRILFESHKLYELNAFIKYSCCGFTKPKRRLKYNSGSSIFNIFM